MAITAPSPQLTQRSATDLAAAIRTKQLTAREVVQAHVDRLHARQPRTNALACDRFADALADADRADERIKTDPDPPPFLGVPCTIKESIGRRGDAELRRPRRAQGPPRRGRRHRRRAPQAGRLHPPRRDEHVGDDDVDRVGQPRLRPHPQRLRPASHRRRLLRTARARRSARAARPSGSAPTSAAASACPRSSTASSGTSPRPASSPTPASSPAPRARPRTCSRSARSPATPRT